MAADGEGVTAGSEQFVSLYRRYRPGRFSELRGQDHVVRALRSAVRDGHVGHAYLFSGPRGTGKTSTARILAKALNCLAPDDGEPCGVCASCVGIGQGTSMDVIELDAASNNGVDAVRDLISHAALGSPGQKKVYIVDEVHMLSTAAANALLKTLEEPPPHVTFVLATTDPQKVPPTIRSRTQHLEFRLLGASVLEGLLRDVRDDAGLGLDDDSISLAVRKGRGSARDALSALDQVAAAGDADDSSPALNEVMEGLCEEDAARSLVALSTLHEVGWGPQQLCVELVDDLRQGFLLSLAPELADLTGVDRDRLADQATRLGLARIVRSIELLGRAQVEMRDAPDPQVVLEVAVARASRTDLDADIVSLLERVGRIERRLEEAGPSAPSSAAPPAPIVPDLPVGEKATIGAYRTAAASPPEAPVSVPDAAPAIEPMPAPAAAPDLPSAEIDEPVTPRDLADGPAISRDDLVEAWADRVLPTLSGATKAMYAAGRFIDLDGNVATLALPTDPHLKRCAEHKAKVEAAIEAVLGQPVSLRLVVDGASPAAVPAVKATAPEKESHKPEAADEEAIDPALLSEAEGKIESVVADRIQAVFPGATLEEG